MNFKMLIVPHLTSLNSTKHHHTPPLAGRESSISGIMSYVLLNLLKSPLFYQSHCWWTTSSLSPGTGTRQPHEPRNQTQLSYLLILSRPRTPDSHHQHPHPRQKCPPTSSASVAMTWTISVASSPASSSSTTPPAPMAAPPSPRSSPRSCRRRLGSRRFPSYT